MSADRAEAEAVGDWVNGDLVAQVPFLDFTVYEEADAIIVIITAPECVSASADALFGPYTATGDRQHD